MSLLKSAIIGVVVWASTSNAGFANEFEPLASSPRPTIEVYRLLFKSIEISNGLQVTSIQPDSPTLSMQSAEQPGLRGVMEIGDIVTAVDGKLIRLFADYHEAMAASHATAGRVELTLRDRLTGRPHRWHVQAQKVTVPAEDRPVDQKRKAHFLLIGLTDDPKIGPAMKLTVDLWKQPIQAFDSERRGNVREVLGSQCRAANILAEVERLDVAARDTLFCFYCGHGAFDAARAVPDDLSRGHHFQIRPSGDLMRKQLLDSLLTKRARLTVLISDTCNIRARAMPFEEMFEEERSVTVMGLSPFEELLMSYRGVVDISGTDFEQYGFCQPGYGSWFSMSALPVLLFHSDWRSALEQMVRVVDNDF